MIATIENVTEKAGVRGVLMNEITEIIQERSDQAEMRMKIVKDIQNVNSKREKVITTYNSPLLTIIFVLDSERGKDDSPPLHVQVCDKIEVRELN